MLYIAISQEIFYKTRLTIRFCIIFIILAWIFSLIVSVRNLKYLIFIRFQFVLVIFSMSPYFGSKSLVDCNYHTCQKPVQYTFGEKLSPAKFYLRIFSSFNNWNLCIGCHFLYCDCNSSKEKEWI